MGSISKRQVGGRGGGKNERQGPINEELHQSEGCPNELFDAVTLGKKIASFNYKIPVNRNCHSLPNNPKKKEFGARGPKLCFVCFKKGVQIC